MPSSYSICILIELNGTEEQSLLHVLISEQDQ